jgi:hypothetical protein
MCSSRLGLFALTRRPASILGNPFEKLVITAQISGLLGEFYCFKTEIFFSSEDKAFLKSGDRVP